jgi:hypothetical protein
LQAFLTTYDELSGRKTTANEAIDESIREVTCSEQHVAAEASLESHSMKKATPQAELERIVVQVIEANGAPLQRTELYRRVTALGIVVGGNNEITNFGSKLSRSKCLVNLRRLGYWPKNQPYEVGGYKPNQASYIADLGDIAD